MSSFSIINNNTENIRINKVSKLEDSKMDQYVLRKQISYSLPNSFIYGTKKENTNAPYFVPTLKQNNKSQVEELQKLQAEINCVEDKIRDLETAKKIKQFKVYIIYNSG